MSVFDVHESRASKEDRSLPLARQENRRVREKSSTENEQNLIVIEDDRGGRVAFKQIAGLLARRIVFDKKEGDEVVRGERVGMIKFGSRVDIFFSPAVNIKVKMCEKVKVGLTVIAEIEEHR
jgi:phosphatidylserine decarboxylase